MTDHKKPTPIIPLYDLEQFSDFGADAPEPEAGNSAVLVGYLFAALSGAFVVAVLWGIFG